jgi:allophanate hydrolase subunit 1
MKAPALLILVLFTVAVHAQSNINNYKYVIVPEKFSFSKSENQYGLNSLVRDLLEEKGFTAFMSNGQIPQEVAANKCGSLMADVTEKRGLFVTNLTLVLKDCQGNIVFKSKEGKSREKEFPVAYDGALRDAYTSLKDAPYQYDGTTLTQTQQVAVIPAPLAPAPASVVPAAAAITDATGTLYAQATPNGFQLIDTTPRKVMALLKTSQPDYYIAQNGSVAGVVFKKNEEWLYEYYKDEKLVSQKLQIKF